MEKEKGIKNEIEFYATRWHGEYAETGMNFHQAGLVFKRMIEEHPDEIIALGVSYRDGDGNYGEVDLARYKNGVVRLLKEYKTDPFLAQEEGFSEIVDDLVVWITARNRALSQKKKNEKQEKESANTDKTFCVIVIVLLALIALSVVYNVVTSLPFVETNETACCTCSCGR